MRGYSKNQKNKNIPQKSRALTVMLVLALITALTGCGASHNSAETTTSMDYAPAGESAMDTGGGIYNKTAGENFAVEEPVEEEIAPEEKAVPEEAGSVGESTDLSETVASNRKLIRRISMNVETQEFVALVQYIEQKVNELGGYMETSEVYGGGYQQDSLKSADFTVRVPVDKLDEMVDAVSQNANVTWKNESATDITLSYVDTQSRKEAYETEYERLMALLQKAEDIETIVALESRLTDVRYEIQNLESQLRTYDNLVDYATITISVNEVEIYTPTTVEPKSDWERMQEGFINSIQEIGSGLKNFGIDFVIALPYLIIWAVFIGVIVLIVRLSVKHSKKKKNLKEQEQDNGRKKGRVCDPHRQTECGEIHTDEPVNRTEDSDYIQ